MAKRQADEDFSPLAKRTRHDFKHAISVLVGPEETSFMLYKNIVCDSSDFFRAAVNGGWKESKEQIVRLPEVDPDVFEIYAARLLTGKVDVLSTLRNNGTAGLVDYKDFPEVEQAKLDNALIRSFALGDVLQDVTFRNSIIDEFLIVTEATIPSLADSTSSCYATSSPWDRR